MDLNQLATEMGLSSDAVKVLGTMPQADQDAFKEALQAASDEAKSTTVFSDDADLNGDGDMDRNEIGTVLKFRKDSAGMLQAFPPNEQDVIRKALQLYIAEGNPAAAFSQRSGGSCMTIERRVELLGYAGGIGQQILKSEKRSPSAAAFSQRHTKSGMSHERRAELLGYTGLGVQILKREKVPAVAFSAKPPTGAQRRREMLTLSGQAARTLKYQQR
jgi:hypothetical protein